MQITPFVWIVTIVVMLAVLIADAVLLARRPHVPGIRECLVFVALYVAAAIAFGLGLHIISGPGPAGEFFAGWLTEYSLSLDNLFIFLIIMTKLKVPRRSQQFALLVGIMLALVFRGIFIGLGAALIARLEWIFFVFGAWLIYTAVNLVRDHLRGSSEEEVDEAVGGPVMRWIQRAVPSTGDFREDRIFVRSNGKLLATSLFFVVVALGTTDVMFALDSIPAIYGLTQEPYIVFTANVFALMGLRQLYFLLGDLLNRLVYLPLGLSVLLTFIGLKLIAHAGHHYGWDHHLGFDLDISTGISLLVIVVILVSTTLASVIKMRADARRERPVA
ncbi:tellurite resistance protein TerC [Propionibacterium cyclohexanicum]|uniref:Tellurite resistance protein TerC n=1 Tax=Propionibacterium cyclohexanicum TaxID=64702 RepID=A0A1H9PKH5_9ACTN|nr:TerC/Alx family metal homeostasis membrane protein [Propionibacterium cyclohexanicum]SER48694.1 tellurite resistance protein TerC [Propionibacterium cyclohexanicum]